MPPTRLLLIRHGETDDNKNLVFQGQDGRGLNDRGRGQASLLAARLVALGPSVRLDALYTSDLDRAHETAQILARALGLSPIEDTDLREVALGAWQGLRHDEVAARFPDEWAMWRAGRDFKRGGGESYAELGARMARAIERAAAACPGGTVGVVSHGAAIKIFVAGILGVGVAELRVFRVTGNTAVSLVERGGDGGYRLVVWNDASHLHDALADAFSAPL